MSEFGTLIFYLLVICIATMLTALAYHRKSKKYKKLYIFLAIFLLAIVAGIRYQVGSDWLQYYQGPDTVGVGDVMRGHDKGSYEIGYILICKFVHLIGLGGSTLLFIYGFLTYLFLYLTVDRYSENISVPFTIFTYGCLYYLPSFNITRQALSISIAMYAISQLDVSFFKNEDNRKAKLASKIRHNLRYFIWGIVSFLFHQSGIVSLLALPICLLMRKKNIVRWIALGVAVFCVANFRMFMQMAIQFTGSASFQWYFIGQVGEQGSWLKYILRYLPMLLLVWMSYKAFKKQDKLFDVYNLTLVGLVINSLSLVVGTEIERIFFPFLYFLTVMMGFGYKNSKNGLYIWGAKLRIPNNVIKLYKIFMIIFLIWNMWYIFFNKGSYQVVPYKTILFY